ncbi:hypothetical protein LJC40_07635 [Synergistaceae bacterium OttesenSCG-928-D05]|nr:hypothetical protein [Synergistaceae bacterium OttesenSCG-928-D05]
MPNLAAFLTYMFLTTFTPGPNTLLAMSTGSRHGFKKTIPLQCGLTVGFFSSWRFPARSARSLRI